jgi:ankyrin repeat protein
MSVVNYKIVTKTADKATAGISSRIHVKVVGRSGSSAAIELGKAKRRSSSKVKYAPFSRNIRSEFNFKAEDVGHVVQLDVWHEDKTSWVMEYMEIIKGNDAWKFANVDPIAPQKERMRRGESSTAVQMTPISHSRVDGGAPNEFHLAAKHGDVDTLERLMAQYDINCKDKNGRTALHYASLYGQVDVVERLLQFRAKLDDTDDDGRTCLHYASMNHKNNGDIVRHILSFAAAAVSGSGSGGSGSSSSHAEIVEHGGSTSDSKQDILHSIIRKGDIFGKTAMHYAATYGYSNIIDVLHRHSANALHAKDKTYQTPLHCTAIHGHHEAARALISAASAPETLLSQIDHQGKSFLHHAATCKQYVYISRLFAKHRDLVTAAMQYQDANGMTPLLCACDSGDKKTTEEIVSIHKLSMFDVDKDKSTAMHHAARRGDAELLGYINSNINAANSYRFTPLHVAVESENLPAVRWLLDHKADVDAKTILDETPLQLAQFTKNQSIISCLETAAKNQVARMAQQQASYGNYSEEPPEIDPEFTVPFPDDYIDSAAANDKPLGGPDDINASADRALLRRAHKKIVKLEAQLRQYRQKFGDVAPASGASASAGAGASASAGAAYDSDDADAATANGTEEEECVIM